MELTEKPDVVIIGSGAGGAAAAWALVQGGLRVLILEAGPRFTPYEDYPLDNPDWEKSQFPEKPNSQGQFDFGDLGVLDQAYADLRGWAKHTRANRVPIGGQRRPQAGGYSHVQGVGGSTLHFVGEAQRLHPDAFRIQTMQGGGADWPISYEELEPFYAQVETAIGVAGEGDAGGRWRSGPFPMPAHPISPGGQALARSGSGWAVNPRAANSTIYDDRPPCNYCGHCARGCPLGDKGSADVTFIRKAEETGLLTILDNAPVQRIVAGPNGRVTHVEFVKNGKSDSVETPVLVLAAGAVQTPRLLLLSASSDEPDGLANASGQVGRNFMETLWWTSAGVAPGLQNSHMGLPADLVDWTYTAPTSVEGVFGGFKLTHATLDMGLNGPIGFATRMAAGIGAAFKARVRESFGSALGISAMGQVIPDERSFVGLSAERRDAYGQPLARINSVLTDNSLQLLRRMAAATRKALGAAGAEIVEEDSSWDRFRSTHVFGTARMGLDAATSVVNAQGRSHDHENLWVCDASVFPTSGGGEAPALTIMALAARSAQAIQA